MSVVFQGRTTTMLRCTLHVCGSRRSSDGDVQPSQLVPSRWRRHHINPRHIAIGVSLTVFPLAPSAVEQLFPAQQSRNSGSKTVVYPRSELFLACKCVVSVHFFHHATFAMWSRSLGAAAVCHSSSGTLSSGDVSSPRRANPQCVLGMHLSRSCSVSSGVCVP